VKKLFINLILLNDDNNNYNNNYENLKDVFQIMINRFTIQLNTTLYSKITNNSHVKQRDLLFNIITNLHHDLTNDPVNTLYLSLLYVQKHNLNMKI